MADTAVILLDRSPPARRWSTARRSVGREIGLEVGDQLIDLVEGRFELGHLVVGDRRPARRAAAVLAAGRRRGPWRERRRRRHRGAARLASCSHRSDGSRRRYGRRCRRCVSTASRSPTRVVGRATCGRRGVLGGPVRWWRPPRRHHRRRTRVSARPTAPTQRETATLTARTPWSMHHCLQLGQLRLTLLQHLEGLRANREPVLEHLDEVGAAAGRGLVDLGLQPEQRAAHRGVTLQPLDEVGRAGLDVRDPQARPLDRAGRRRRGMPPSRSTVRPRRSRRVRRSVRLR